MTISVALVAMGCTALVNSALQRHFTREWLENLRVKRKEPLSEDEVMHPLEK